MAIPVPESGGAAKIVLRDAHGAGRRRAVRWLADHALISDDAADRFLAEHPEPEPR